MIDDQTRTAIDRAVIAASYAAGLRRHNARCEPGCPCAICGPLRTAVIALKEAAHEAAHGHDEDAA